MNDKTAQNANTDQTGELSERDSISASIGNVSDSDTLPKPEKLDAGIAMEVYQTATDLNLLDLEGIEERIKAALHRSNEVAARAAKAISSGSPIPYDLYQEVSASLQEIIDLTKWTQDAARDLVIPVLEQVSELRKTTDSYDWKIFVAGITEGEERVKALEPFLEDELDAIQLQPGYEDMTVEDLEVYINLDGRTIEENPETGPIPPFIREAIERAFQNVKRQELPEVKARRADLVALPLDKVNSTIWNKLQEQVGAEPSKWPIKAEKDGSERQISIMYEIDFSGLEDSGLKITKTLLPFDKRVYIAIAALYNSGNTVISLTQIYYTMGYNTNTKPAPHQIQRIHDSVTKMAGARVFVDNSDEIENSYKYPRFRYDGPLLPIERQTAIVNGKIADAAIHIFREPPVMTFAKQRKQITTISVKALQSPISKTNDNLLIDDYLLERIAKAKRTGKSFKIRFATLYEKAQITSGKQKTRAIPKIETYLKHYVSCGLISRYEVCENGIQIDFPEDSAKKKLPQ